jgi:hypothetical protein
MNTDIIPGIGVAIFMGIASGSAAYELHKLEVAKSVKPNKPTQHHHRPRPSKDEPVGC